MASRATRLAQILKEKEGEVNIQVVSRELGEPTRATSRLLRQVGWRSIRENVWMRENAEAFGFALAFTCAVLLASRLV